MVITNVHMGKVPAGSSPEDYTVIYLLFIFILLSRFKSTVSARSV